MTLKVRQQAISPAHSYLVQAPAGSGKTELLTQRILSLLAVVDEPEEILAMTFTRKAAAEMRHRVLLSLSMSEPDDTSSHQMHTWALAQAALARSREKGWNLTEYSSRLRIMTLDSLTGALARQLPLLSGSGDMPTPCEHTHALCRQASERVLSDVLKDDFDAVKLLLLHQDHNVVGLIKLISTMLESREQWLKYIGEYGRDTGGLRRVLEANMAAWMEQTIQHFDAMVPLAVKTELPRLIRFSGANLGNQNTHSLTVWPDDNIENASAYALLANFLLVKDKANFKKRISKTEGFPAQAKPEKNDMLEILSVLTGIPGLGDALHALRRLPETPRFDAQQWRILESIFHILPRAVLQLQMTFTAQGRMDFTGIALRALDALSDAHGHPSDVLLKLDYRIRHILMDEFQDTSELQIRLLRCLTSGWQAGDGRSLFMVGDPMQSIYRFRKANVGLFLQAADNQAGLPIVTTLQLERNFRSAPKVVDWVNAAFYHLFPQVQDSVNGTIPYAAATAALTHDGGVWLHVQQGRDDAMEAVVALELIRKALDRQQRVGVLARTRKHLHALILALSEAAIAFRAVHILSLYTRPEVRALRALMRALLHPADRESWAAILRMPCCGLTTADMFALMSSDARPVWDILQDASKKRGNFLSSDAHKRVRHITQALAPCIMMGGKINVRDLVQIAWLRLGMPHLLDATAQINVETVLDLIDALDVEERMGGRIHFERFDERLQALYAAPDIAQEAAQVELMTMHGAKGLQWDVVILPGLGKATKNSDAPWLAVTETLSDANEMILMSPKAATRSKDALYDLIRNIEKDKEHNELMRLLYVACTRAETELHLLGHVSEKRGNPGKNSFMELLYQYGEDCFGAEVYVMQPAESAVSNVHLPLKRIKQVPETLPVTQEATHGIEVEYGWAGAEAAPVGNAVHAVLQRVGEKGVENWNEALTGENVKLMRRMLLKDGLSGSLLEDALIRCEKALSNASSSERGRWILSGMHMDVHCEWALSLHDKGMVSHHVIDRSFVDESDIRWIIDYKTASHEGGDIAYFLDAEQKRHAPQLQRYAALLRILKPEREIRTALYFPMLDVWKEVSVCSAHPPVA